MRAWTEWAEWPASTDSRNVKGFEAGGEAGRESLVYFASEIGRCCQRQVQNTLTDCLLQRAAIRAGEFVRKMRALRAIVCEVVRARHELTE